jgi:glycine cleavage system H lipoate-binding protein
MTAPDFFEPLIGYRAWHLSPRAELVPWSLAASGAWVPGVNTAVCHAGKKHHPPAADCMCGLYALASARDRRLHGSEGQIVGAIAAWGDIELHRTGFRAEHAAVVALAEPLDGDSELAKRAAERYEVALVPREELQITALRFGQPVDPAILDEPVQADTGLHLGETGVALVEHMWCKPDAATLTLGITRAFASQLDDSIEVTLPPDGTRITARDPLATLHTRFGNLIAWACASGHLYESNERVLRDPSLLRDDPEAGGWLARIVPSAWPDEARNFSWGPAARTSYAAELGRAARGEDVYADLRAERIFAGPRADGMIDIVAELRRRRSEPRFENDADVYAVCAEPVRERIARSARAARFEAVVRYRVSAPEAELTLSATPAGVSLTCGPSSTAPTLTLSMTAETAAQHFSGRLDIARALRAGLVTSDRPRVETLRTMALLKPLLGPARG